MEIEQSAIVLGITGKLLEDYNPVEEILIKELLLRTIEQTIQNANGRPIYILSHFVNNGISKVAYDWADDLALYKAGIAPAGKRGVYRLVHKFTFVDGDWGDDIPLFVECSKLIISFGISDRVTKIVEVAKERNKKVFMFDIDEKAVYGLTDV